MIASYKLPGSLDIVSALPISGAGKVLKRELRKRSGQASAGSGQA
jgi:non-ribosomal peptide synthetase component E (peptide arylation enzyme)